MKILLFTGSYLPGFKGGGPIRSIANMLDKLGDDIQFYVVTADCDLGEVKAYEGVTSDGWQQVGRAQLYYASPGVGWLRRLYQIIRAFDGRAIHLNSFFSFRFSVLPLLYWRVIKPRHPVILGPRGEFSQGAVALKPFKKLAFIALVKALGLYKGVIWHASTSHEADDIRRVMGENECIRVAVNIARPAPDWAPQPRLANAPLRLLFISRISPMKNLLGAIQMLQLVPYPVVFNVYGPAEDAAYWASCQAAAKLLAHVQFSYGGALYPAQVPEVMARHDLFYLPTLGENFGQVIAEALGCGLPVLIADTTPWRELERQKLGWDIPLSQPHQFLAAIEACSQMPAAEYAAWRQSIRDWSLANIGNNGAVEQNRQLFLNLDSTNGH